MINIAIVEDEAMYAKQLQSFCISMKRKWRSVQYYGLL